VRRWVSPRTNATQRREPSLHAPRHKQRNADDEKYEHNFGDEEPPDTLPHRRWVMVMPHTSVSASERLEITRALEAIHGGVVPSRVPDLTSFAPASIAA
jgi:hypothetical protein